MLKRRKRHTTATGAVGGISEAGSAHHQVCIKEIPEGFSLGYFFYCAHSTKMQLVKSRRSRVWNPQLVCGMESSRSDVCNQSEGEIHADAWCHAVALRRIPYILRVIQYQSFGLDRKKQVSRLAFFLAPPAGLVKIKQHGCCFIKRCATKCEFSSLSYA